MPYTFRNLIPSWPKIKISVITDMLVLRFYEYISTDILTKNIGWSKIDQNE